MVADLLHGSAKVRELVSNAHPFIILDEFQDTNGGQWNVVRALGDKSTLIALADPEQRIFDFIGADPERLNHFRKQFKHKEVDLAGENHRSKGTEIALFGNEILKGKFSQKSYAGMAFNTFEANPNQALTTLNTTTLQVRDRLIKKGKKGWSLAVLVPTKKLTRQVSDSFRAPLGGLPVINHHAAVDMEGAILGAEVVAYLMQPHDADHLPEFVELVCGYYRGRGGDTPTQTGLDSADAVKNAYKKCQTAKAKGKAPPKASIFVAMQEVYDAARALALTGDPDVDWRSIRLLLEQGKCKRLQEIAEEVKNIRVLDRGTQLRQTLAQDWRDNGAYANALEIVRLAFVQEHFSTAHKPETGVIVMNMHKAKGKQFDEVIIFEGWPRFKGNKIEANIDRIIQGNARTADMSQARQNFRVSVTRARQMTTILTPRVDPCVLLIPEK